MGVASPVRYQAASDRQYAKKLTGVGQTPVERGLNETGSTPPNRGGSDPRSDRDDKDLLKKKKKNSSTQPFSPHIHTVYIIFFTNQQEEAKRDRQAERKGLVEAGDFA